MCTSHVAYSVSKTLTVACTKLKQLATLTPYQCFYNSSDVLKQTVETPFTVCQSTVFSVLTLKVVAIMNYTVTIYCTTADYRQ